jgi:2-oxoacid:acceptor oxidoreductase delta subunit (pyruvate/2-ketoisovalerate family)
MPVLNALDVLRDTELENPTHLYGHVVVYGGGNTAMDVARSAIRLGAQRATAVVLEAREHMTAHVSEIQEAEEEGTQLVPLRSVQRIEGNVLHLERMSATNERWPRPTGTFEAMQADVLVQAIGQQVETGLLEGIPGLVIEDGRARVDDGMRTDAEGVFAGGDMIPSGGSVTAAIGHGKKAARHIDAYLRGTTCQPAERSELALLEYLEPWYYSDAPRSQRPKLDVVRRTSGFAEVVGNLDEETAAYEARRCMSCGNCFECDNCYGVCPDNAVVKLGPGKGFEFKYDYCKGCGLCVSECPCGAIKMIPEDI